MANEEREPYSQLYNKLRTNSGGKSDMNRARKIIHVDMDAFFAAVYVRDHPEVKGKPVICGGPANSRGVVSTCNYEARKYGIHSAMPSFKAHKLCPNGIFVKPEFDAIREASKIAREIFYEYSDLVEPVSIDEAYIDVTENKKKHCISYSDRYRD